MLKGKVVLVTGSSRGIGREIAKAFAMSGCKVVINYHANKKAALETVKEIKDTFYKTFEDVEYPSISQPEPIIIKADISVEHEVMLMFAEVMRKFGRIDILVNNAGIYKNAVSWRMAKETWDKVIATNLTGPFLCAKYVLPYMRKQKWGRIINISSVLGQIGAAGGCNYAASKAGLFGLTKSIAKEVANKGITVNCVTIGYLSTGMTYTLSQEIRDWVIEHTPLKRFGKPEELASLVKYLCTEGASFITGQVIHINGGLYV